MDRSKHQQEKVIKVGLIGASWFTDLWFLPVLTRHPGVQVTAICSKNGESARNMADKYNIPQVYSSAIEMMDHGALDGVCIVTPNVMHHPLVMAALERGLHVLCEKPLGMNGEQTDEMRMKATEMGVVTSINFSVRENAGIQYLRGAVKAGAIGRLTEGRFQYAGDYGLPGRLGWRGSVEEAGAGGVLQDLGSHLIDLVQYVLQDERIVSVQSSLRCLENGHLVDFADRADPNHAADSVYFQATFASGAHGFFHTSWISPQAGGEQTVEFELHGTEGSLILTTSGYGTKLLYGKVGQSWEVLSLPDAHDWDLNLKEGEERFRPYRNSEKNEAWKWADAVHAFKFGNKQHSAENLPSFEQGDYVQRVIDSVLRSAETKSTSWL